MLHRDERNLLQLILLTGIAIFISYYTSGCGKSESNEDEAPKGYSSVIGSCGTASCGSGSSSSCGSSSTGTCPLTPLSQGSISIAASSLPESSDVSSSSLNEKHNVATIAEVSKEHEQLIVVFGVPFCGGCERMRENLTKAVIPKLVEEKSSTIFIYFEIKQTSVADELVKTYGLEKEYPQTLVLKNGDVHSKKLGFVSSEDLMAISRGLN